MSALFDSMLPVVSFATLAAFVGWVLKSALLMAGALLLCRLLPRSSAATRHLIARASTLGAFILVIGGSFVPVWQLPPSEIFSVTLPSLVAAISTSTTAGITGSLWLTAVVLVWLIGFSIFATRFVLGVLVMRRLIRQAQPIDDTEFLATATRIGREIGIRGRVRYLESQQLTVPLTWGIVRPVVVFPSPVTTDSSEQAMLLRHELAHVRRHDILWLNLATILSIVQWFNPFAWWVKDRMQVESEYACDNYVLSTQVEPDSYARHLLEYARSAIARDGLVNTHLAFNSHLEGRIMSILHEKKREYLTGLQSKLWVAAALIAGCLALAGITLESCGSFLGGDSESSLSINESSNASQDDLLAVETMPEMIYMENPVYPESAKEAGIEGQVWIKAFVEENGHVTKAEVAKSSSTWELDDAALAAAVKNRFKPALKGGKPVGVWITYQVQFALSDEKAP